MKYHRYRFGLLKNINVWICRTFGHRLNENPSHHWCERCGLAYEECYYPKDWWVASGIVKVADGESIDYTLDQLGKELDNSDDL